MTSEGIEFQLFVAYAMEKMDVYGRLLAFLNCNQPEATNPGPRSPGYNQGMRDGGFARPYFFWPNIDPFFRNPTCLALYPTAIGITG